MTVLLRVNCYDENNIKKRHVGNHLCTKLKRTENKYIFTGKEYWGEKHLLNLRTVIASLTTRKPVCALCVISRLVKECFYQTIQHSMYQWFIMRVPKSVASPVEGVRKPSSARWRSRRGKRLLLTFISATVQYDVLYSVY